MKTLPEVTKAVAVLGCVSLLGSLFSYASLTMAQEVEPSPTQNSPQIALADAGSGGKESGAVATGPTFPITRFQVEGNVVLSADKAQAALASFVGADGNMSKIDAAVIALRNAYAAAGYPIVQIYPPQQTINDGLVVLRVVEGKLSAIGVAGNKRYDEANIRNSVPALKEGQDPNVKDVAAAVALANENPAKQVAVNFQPGADPGDVIARIDVTEEDPSKSVIAYNNYGTHATGYDIISYSYQNANLFNRDHTLTADFSTTVQHPSDVKNFSFGYRIPFYSIGWSLDLIAAYSDSATNSTQTGATSLGTLQFTGKGTILGARMNESLPGLGEYRQKITYELDYKNFNDQCGINGVSTGSCGTVTSQPLILSYIGTLTTPTLQAGGNISYVQNIPGGPNGEDTEYAAARLGASRNWNAWRLGGYVVKPFAGDWQVRANLTMQQTSRILIPSEQFGIGGSSSVRGFDERVLAGDKGTDLNLELYTPDFGSHLSGAANADATANSAVPSNHKLRGVFFIDYGSVRNNDSLTVGTATLSSVGLGLRYEYKKSFNLKLDIGLAQHTNVDSSWNTVIVKLNDDSGRWLGPVQLSASYSF
jgi:hemolysin activation/secretion protein